MCGDWYTLALNECDHWPQWADNCSFVSGNDEALQDALPVDNIGFNVNSKFTSLGIIMNNLGQIGDGYAPMLNSRTSHIAVMFAELSTKINSLSLGTQHLIVLLRGKCVRTWLLLSSRVLRRKDPSGAKFPSPQQGWKLKCASQIYDLFCLYL